MSRDGFPRGHGGLSTVRGGPDGVNRPGGGILGIMENQPGNADGDDGDVTGGDGAGSPPPVVAAVDGSRSAVGAAVWAAREAGRRGTRLRLVHAYVVPTRGYPDFLSTFPQLREAMADQGRRWLDEARAAAGQAVPELPVEAGTVEGEVVPALLAESHGAALVVVGSRGLGGFTGMLVGSVALALATHAHSPVAVVRGPGPDDPPPTEGPVVVGTDGSPESRRAVDYAFAAAAARAVPLVAVRAWNDALVEGLSAGSARHYPVFTDLDRVDADVRDELEHELADGRARHPDVAVEPVVSRRKPTRALLEYSGRAQLVVVGNRGRGGFTGMLLGSTSRSLIQHASCPVAVVRESPGPDDAGAPDEPPEAAGARP